MNSKEMATMLNELNLEYGYPQIPKEIIELAKKNNLVIVYGASDDLMEFDGAICDEIGCYDGGSAYITKGGDVCDLPRFAGEKEIEAIWCNDKNSERDATWTYKTDIPYEKFVIKEDEEIYCVGIVFSVDDLN